MRSTKSQMALVLYLLIIDFIGEEWPQFIIVTCWCLENQVLLDCGAVQADALTVDRLASLEKVCKCHLYC